MIYVDPSTWVAARISCDCAIRYHRVARVDGNASAGLCFVEGNIAVQNGWTTLVSVDPASEAGTEDPIHESFT